MFLISINLSVYNWSKWVPVPDRPLHDFGVAGFLRMVVALGLGVCGCRRSVSAGVEGLDAIPRRD